MNLEALTRFLDFFEKGLIMLEDLGSAVRVYDTIIPAINISVEGVPTFVHYSDIGDIWYGVYFEVMLEDGRHLVVERYKKSAFDNDIKVQIWHNYDKMIWDWTNPDNKMTFWTWTSFVKWFNTWKQSTCPHSLV